MVSLAESERETDGREALRTHMFVAATLYHGEHSQPVRIRNMSTTGALVEGEHLPLPGLSLKLRRGSLQAHGQIAWRSGRKAGISFTAPVDVALWMSNIGSYQQARIDREVAGLKSLSTRRTIIPGFPGDTGLSKDPRGELELLKSELASLSAALAADSELVAKHPEIQIFDIALQRLDRLLTASSLPVWT